MFKYALLGREGSGRAFFQDRLKEIDLKVAKSYTTRKPYNDNDTSHYFIEKEHLPDYKKRLIETTHNDNIYFYTHAELEKADVIPVDPENLDMLCALFPDTPFRVIEIVASNENRLKHAVTNAEDKITAEEDFITICEAENEAFCDFEDKLKSAKLEIPNSCIGHVVTNDFSELSDVYTFGESILAERRLFNRMNIIINDLVNNGNITRNDEHKLELWVHNSKTNKPEAVWLSLDMFTEATLADDKGISSVTAAWLMLKKTTPFTE